MRRGLMVAAAVVLAWLLVAVGGARQREELDQMREAGW
jgi:hypothetical protein